MTTENQNIKDTTSESKKGFLPFVLIFGGIIVALILIKLLINVIM
jgi:hypothetical protein